MPDSSPHHSSTHIEGDVHGDVLIAGRDIVYQSLSREDRVDKRNRQVLLDKVQQFWVEGVLEKSLHGVALLELGMEVRQDAIDHPWDTMIKRLDEAPEPLPPGMWIADVFDAMGQSMLILGAPGAGKTTILLELARDLIKRVREDDSLPVPVVLNLSSWSVRQGELGAWIVSELNAKYLVPTHTGEQWLADQALTLLLDGLDEVRATLRDDCVEAINAFRDQHGLMPVVVCSRIADYEAIEARLKMEGAILLQPLTDEQIGEYFQRAGQEYLAVRTLIREDEGLAELARSPLMLSIMLLAYKGVSVADIPEADSPGARRKHLFDTYIERMFKRRGEHPRYQPEQTREWLSWIAARMQESGQSIFLLETMQSRWLGTRGQRLMYGLFQRVVAGGLIGLVLGVFGGLLASIMYMVVEMIFGRVPLAEAVMENLTISVMAEVLGSTISFGLALGVLVSIVAGRGANADIEAVETVQWSPRWSWKAGGWGAFVGLLIGLLMSISFIPDAPMSTIYEQTGGRVPSSLVHFQIGLTLVNPGLTFGAGIGGILAVIFGFVIAGLQSNQIETRSAPNEGMRRSLRNALILGVVIILGASIISLPFGFLALNFFPRLFPGYDSSDTLAYAPTGIVDTGFFLGMLAGVVSAYSFGGRALSQHISLRIVLFLRRVLPLRLARFLDHAADLIFMRRLGGSYIFIHRLLLEHFALRSGSVLAPADAVAQSQKPAPTRHRRIRISASVVGWVAGSLSAAISVYLLVWLFGLGGLQWLRAERVSCIDYTDGRIATGSVDERFVEIRDANSGDTVSVIDLSVVQGHTNLCNLTDRGLLMPDSVAIFDTETGEPFYPPPGEPPAYVSRAPGRSTLFGAYLEGEAAYTIWDTTSRERVATLEHFPENAGANTVGWSPKASYVFRFPSEQIRIWRTDSGELYTNFDISDIWSDDANFRWDWSADESQIAAGNEDQILVWDLDDTEPHTTFKIDDISPGKSILGFSWSPHSHIMAVDTYEQILLWDSVGGEVVKAIDVVTESRRSNAARWTADGSSLAWYVEVPDPEDPNITYVRTKVINVSNEAGYEVAAADLYAWGSPFDLPPREPEPFAYQLFVDENEASLIDWETREVIQTFTLPDMFLRGQVADRLRLDGLPYSIHHIDSRVSPDGQKVAIWNRVNIIQPGFGGVYKPSGVISVWDVEGGELLRLLRGHREEPDFVFWSPDSSTLYSLDYPTRDRYGIFLPEGDALIRWTIEP